MAFEIGEVVWLPDEVEAYLQLRQKRKVPFRLGMTIELFPLHPNIPAKGLLEDHELREESDET